MSSSLGELPGVEICGSGVALPRDVDPELEPLDNERIWPELFGAEWRAELERRGWDADHSERAWGVRTRHAWPRAGESHSESLACAAAERALDEAGIEARELAGIVVATSTPARISSSLASSVGKTLASDAAVCDLRAGGASGLAAWSQAALQVAHGAQPVLVVAVDCVPDFLAADDVTNRLLFSCAAGALVLRAAPGERTGLVGTRAGRVDTPGRAFTIPGALPPADARRYTFQPADAAYLESLRATWELALGELCGLADGAPDFFLPYAVTRGQLERAGVAVGADVSAALRSLRDHGCTGCASPFLQLDALRKAGGLGAGSTLGVVAVGGGISWQALLWRS